jgi:uncharacterized membrane protein YczE
VVGHMTTTTSPPNLIFSTADQSAVAPRAGRTTPDSSTRRWSAALAGWTLIGCGVSLLIASGLGGSPYDTLILGVSHRVGLEPGTVSWVLGALMLLLASVLGRTPGIGAVLGIAVVGAVLAVLVPLFSSLAGPAQLLAAPLGLASLLLGVSLGVASRIGPGPVELVHLALTQRGLPFLPVRFALDASCLALGLVLGGPAGPATAVFLLTAPAALRRLAPLTNRLVHPPSTAPVSVSAALPSTQHLSV